VSCIVTEEDYKTLKLENNLDNLNKDMQVVNREVEQIKKWIFDLQNDDNSQEDLSYEELK
jgi:hypothetical protein